MRSLKKNDADDDGNDIADDDDDDDGGDDVTMACICSSFSKHYQTYQ